MRRIRENMNRLAAAAYVKGVRAKEKAVDVLSQKNGLKILISVVIGALLLAGLYTLFKDTVLPTLTEKVRTLFNYQG